MELRVASPLDLVLPVTCLCTLLMSPRAERLLEVPLEEARRVCHDEDFKTATTTKQV